MNTHKKPPTREVSGVQEVAASRPRSKARIAAARGSLRPHDAEHRPGPNGSHHLGEGNRLITVTELAAELSVPVSWIYSHTRLRNLERIPHLKLGKYVRFHPLAVRDWLERLGGIA